MNVSSKLWAQNLRSRLGFSRPHIYTDGAVKHPLCAGFPLCSGVVLALPRGIMGGQPAPGEQAGEQGEPAARNRMC